MFKRLISYCLCCVALLLGAACAVNENPADGGFISAIVGKMGGTYEEREEDRENSVEQHKAEKQKRISEKDELKIKQQRALDEIAELEAELQSLKRRIVQQRRDLASNSIALPGTLKTQMEIALQPRPVPEDSVEERIASLRSAISDSKALLSSLASLGE